MNSLVDIRDDFHSNVVVLKNATDFESGIFKMTHRKLKD